MANYEQGNGDGGAGKKTSDDDRKIFVGGLSWETKEQDFREYFSKFGEVTDCTLKTDPGTGKSRGFGFITFGTASDVDKVINEHSHTLHGRNIDPKRAKARPGREPIKKVFVGGLDPDVPEEDVRSYFGNYGTIDEVNLPYDKQKSCRRAFAFITFSTEAQADECCKMAKHTIGGKEVDVKKAVNKPQDGGYGYNWGYGYDGRGGARGGAGARGFGGRGGGGARGGRGGYNDWGNQGTGYDYGSYGSYDGYGGYGGYGGYDYNDYYNQGWGNNQGYDSSNYGSYGNYGASTYDYGNQASSGYKGGNTGYHPYNK